MTKQFQADTEKIQNVVNCMTPVQVGEKIVSQTRLNEIEISQFAHSIGDPNLLHHDAEYARKTRFGSIIVCGPHISCLMMALAAQHFSQNYAMVGLDFFIQFLKALKAGELIDLEWEVVATQYKDSLNGEIVDLKGKVTNEQGVIAVTTNSKILVTKEF
ncbi:MaoC family dehydratase [Mastigocladopsis repens]|uniref:MaoC family dehydratase n=1 Tax=Mastigocladopsis repens TaxID=221287 RepID=UPI0002F135E7|nr:MaoC family dehydratase [Mastigocladopsis repens]